MAARTETVEGAGYLESSKRMLDRSGFVLLKDYDRLDEILVRLILLVRDVPINTLNLLGTNSPNPSRFDDHQNRMRQLGVKAIRRES